MVTSDWQKLCPTQLNTLLGFIQNNFHFKHVKRFGTHINIMCYVCVDSNSLTHFLFIFPRSSFTSPTQ